MAREFFKDLPNTTTPLNSVRLNGLLNGEEALGTIVVDDVVCKNMFDINGEINVLDDSDTIDNKNTANNNVLTTSTNTWTQHATGQKYTNLNGKTITVSAKVVSTGTGQYGSIQIRDNNVQVASEKGATNDVLTLTYTCTSNNIKVTFSTTGDSQAQSGTGAQFTNIQVELGSVKTDYVPYKGHGTQYGTNSRGSWLKLDDGTMICWRNNYTDTINITTQWGSLYVGGITNNVSFPQTFKEPPVVQYNILPTSSTGCFTVCYEQPNITTSYINNLSVARPRPSSNVPIKVSYIAIGKWK